MVLLSSHPAQLAAVNEGPISPITHEAQRRNEIWYWEKWILIVIMFSLVCNNLKQSIVFHGCRDRAFHGFSGTRRFVFEEVYAEKYQPTYQMGFSDFPQLGYLPLKLKFLNFRSENSFVLLANLQHKTVFTSSSLLTDWVHNKCPCSHPAVRLRAAIGGSFIRTARHFTLKEQINSIESFF